MTRRGTARRGLPAVTGGVQLRVPARDNLSLRAVPRHVGSLLRGRSEEFDEDFWSMLGSGTTDLELDRQALLLRRTRPYRDEAVFDGDGDLGPFAHWASFEQQESVVQLDERVYLSPNGWVIRPQFQLVGRGLTRDHCGITRPSVRSYGAVRMKRSAVRVPTVLTLRDPAEHNYYHLFTDVLAARLRLAAEAGISPDIPVLVSEAVYRNADFQEVLRRSDLGDREILVQPAGRFVCADGVVIVQTPWFSKTNFHYLQQWLSIPEGDHASKRRLFVVRRAETGRTASNMAAVEDLARRYGFELVSTEGMSLAQEIDLFSEARIVVGLMGAALFNLVWRRNAPLSLLEIFPTFISKADPYYFYMARALGFRYRHYGDGLGAPYEQPTTMAEVRQHKDRKRMVFEIDTERLGPMIETMLEECV